MTVKELYGSVGVSSGLKVIDGETGKILCYRYNVISPKHEKIGRREILHLWADIEVTDDGFGNYARPYLCVYVMAEKGDNEK